MMLLTGSKEQKTLEFYKNAGYNCTDKTAFIQWLDIWDKFQIHIWEKRKDGRAVMKIDRLLEIIIYLLKLCASWATEN